MQVLSLQLILSSKILEIVATTTVLASQFFYGFADVSVMQEPTYTDEMAQTITATTTEVAPTPVLTEEEIVTAAILKAFPDAPIMVKVAQCESGLDPSADRQNLGVDVGLFQINQVHLKELSNLGLDRTNMDDNIAYARILYNQSGLAPWKNSRYCWGT